MIKGFLAILGFAAVGTLFVAGVILFYQSRLIYFPRPYGGTEVQDIISRGGRAVEVETSQGKQVAYYLPPPQNPMAEPKFVWLVFGGNGSLSLDYADLPSRWDGRFGYLFVDYPGYGQCEGVPSPAALQESVVKLTDAFRMSLGWDEDAFRSRSGVFGHSLGCAVALITADELQLKRAVLCAPFTSMTDMGRLFLGRPLCYLNLHRFDNVSRLRRLASQSAKVHVFHGARDEVIPVTMGQSLAERFPGTVTCTVVSHGDHNGVVQLAGNDIGQVMLELSGLPTS